ncbi:hypothetical protein POM88_031458 [Heracleum sosnowskyi]|uniref:Poly(A) polymerase nucleotidyltransferase domain-containing protein n=1 Tax=Heracleum sosnowskyi TaxID=360622 RepID=A0AAD8I0D2_9APIA|nr:hypothetical protein POM88_031458 [Heracleum sosnowskyi]
MATCIQLFPEVDEEDAIEELLERYNLTPGVDEKKVKLDIVKTLGKLFTEVDEEDATEEFFPEVDEEDATEELLERYNLTPGADEKKVKLDIVKTLGKLFPEVEEEDAIEELLERYNLTPGANEKKVKLDIVKTLGKLFPEVDEEDATEELLERYNLTPGADEKKVKLDIVKTLGKATTATEVVSTLHVYTSRPPELELFPEVEEEDVTEELVERYNLTPGADENKVKLDIVKTLGKLFPEVEEEDATEELLERYNLTPGADEKKVKLDIIKTLGKVVFIWIREVVVARYIRADDAWAEAVTYGSYALEVDTPGSDMDIVVIGPTFATLKEDFLGKLSDHIATLPGITNLQTIEGAKVPLIKFIIHGTSIDICYMRVHLTTLPKKEEMQFSSLEPQDECGRLSFSSLLLNDALSQIIPFTDLGKV